VGKIDYKAIWKADKEGEVPPLSVAIMRRYSAYHMAFGVVNGHRFVSSAQGDLYPFKLANTILGYNRHTHKCLAAAEGPLKLTGVAVNYLYRAMGIDTFECEDAELDFSVAKNTYMGSSSGLHPGHRVTVPMDSGANMIISANGKKIENLESDLDQILRFLECEEEFETFFTVTPKNEYKFDNKKCYSKEQFAAWCQKSRVFVIPTSTFVLAERLVSKTRQRMERRNKLIRIGQKWAFGGVDNLAIALGIDLHNMFKRIMVEGDVKNFDQSVQAVFVKLYMSTMLIHENPESEDYAMKKKLVEYLAQRLASRITLLYGSLWAIHKGGVPSGCYNTSHMDSWIMALYFFLFCAWQVATCPDADREAVEEAVLDALLAVYGDDHLYNKGETAGSAYLSGHQFAFFMKQYFDVDIRDIFDGIPFLSRTYEGFLSDRGACFLRHFFILNPHSGEGQAKFIPFRETFEYISRAVWGREVKERDLFDVLLSVLGHAYGNYASNKEAYIILRLMYEGLLTELKIGEGEALSIILSRMGPLEIRKLRQQSMTTDNILQGFPTWDELIARNVYNEDYHDITDDVFTHDVDYFRGSDFF